MGKYKRLLIILISLILIQLYYASVASSVNTSSSVDGWTMFRHDTSHSGYLTGNSPANSVKLLWAFETMSAVASSPAVANGCVFVGCNDGAVYCLNSSNGELVWYYVTERYYPNQSEAESSPAIDNGCVYIGSDDGNVYALNASNGAKLWNYTTGSEVDSSPAVVDGVVYIGSDDGNVYALNASNGAKLWNNHVSRRVVLSVDSSPAVSDGVVYIASNDYFVYALNASTGNEIWHSHTGSVISSPSVYNDYIYIGSYDGYVCGLNASTGAKIWEYQTENSVDSSPAVAYGCVYVGSEDNNVYCLNASNGEKIWQSPTGYWVKSSPVVAYGNVYVGSEDYSIYCLDASTGAKKWSYATGNFVDSSPAIVNGTLYVGSDDHHIYAFDSCNSAVGTIPSQFTNSLAWTTIAVDVIACAVGVIIISVIMLFIHSTRRAKRNAEAMNVSSQNLPWFSAHADALCVLAILAFSIIFFVNLGSGPLWAADEQTYSQGAFYMIKNGDYLTPWAYGSISWIGKPPLIMWLMSLAYQVFGVNNFATRFWSSVFGTCSLILVFYLGKELFNRYVGFISALVLGTFVTFYSFARHAMTDMPLVFFSLASIYFLLLSEKNKNSNRYVALSGLFFGFAFMTKQVQALLIPVIVFAYLATTQRSLKFLFTKRFTLFWGVALLVFAPWLIYMNNSFGTEFWHWFLVHSAINRSVVPLEGHIGSYLFYFRYLINNENLLWIIILPFAAGLCVYNAIIKHIKQDILLLEWIVIVFAILTFVQTKLYWYILPALPAFAIAIGNLLYLFFKKIQARAYR